MGKISGPVAHDVMATALGRRSGGYARQLATHRQSTMGTRPVYGVEFSGPEDFTTLER
jgi:hypothetical protein